MAVSCCSFSFICNRMEMISVIVQSHLYTTTVFSRGCELGQMVVYEFCNGVWLSQKMLTQIKKVSAVAGLRS